MHWEAALVIGIVALGAGLILYIPGYFLAKWALRKSPPDSGGRLHVTFTGFVVYGSMIIMLAIGFAQQFFAPETFLGRLTSTSLGRLLFCASIIPLGVVIEFVLRKFGIHCVKTKRSV